MTELQSLLHDPVLDYVGRILGAGLILLAGWLALHFLSGPLRRLLEHGRADPSLASFLANSARTVFLVVVVLGVLQQLGVQTASLLTLLGAAGLAVALSLQGSLANFASGLLALSFRMVRVGDLVEIGDIRGRVTEMLPFHIVLVSADNQQITVPNTLLTSGPVRNHSALSRHRVLWTLPLDVRDDLAAVKEALRNRLQADGRVLADPRPRVFVQEWCLDKRLLAVEAWTAAENYLALQQEMLEVLGLRLDQERQVRSPEPPKNP